jgi:hypothetical protein
MAWDDLKLARREWERLTGNSGARRPTRLRRGRGLLSSGLPGHGEGVRDA